MNFDARQGSKNESVPSDYDSIGTYPQVVSLLDATAGAAGTAVLLAGAWRDEPPALALNGTQLADLTPSLLQSGVAALAYWRVRRSPLRESQPAQALRAGFQTQAVRTPFRLHEIQKVVTALAGEGIEPLLFKGWAIARHYPDVPLRPFTDIDLFVRPDRLEHALRVVRGLKPAQLAVDLHTQTDDTQHATKLAARTLEELYHDSGRVLLGDVPIRVLSAEDHLHLLALHCLRHGAWQPLWLCDIAVALETRPTGFDWTRCLGESPEADYVACACGLAHQLLGARIDDTPVAARANNLPRWLVPAVLRQWTLSEPALHYPPEPIRHARKDPRRLARAVRARWIDPLQATMLTNGTFDESPRLIVQARYFLGKGTRFVLRPRRSP